MMVNWCKLNYFVWFVTLKLNLNSGAGLTPTRGGISILIFISHCHKPDPRSSQFSGRGTGARSSFQQGEVKFLRGRGDKFNETREGHHHQQIVPYKR